jgi:hypothetical protein
MPPWAPLNAAPTSRLLAGPAGTPGFPSLRCAARRRTCAPSGHRPRAWAPVAFFVASNTSCRCQQGCGWAGPGANCRRRGAQPGQGCPPRSGGTARIAEHRCPRSGQKGEFRSRPGRASTAGHPRRRRGRRRLSARACPPAALLAMRPQLRTQPRSATRRKPASPSHRYDASSSGRPATTRAARGRCSRGASGCTRPAASARSWRRSRKGTARRRCSSARRRSSCASGCRSSPSC